MKLLLDENPPKRLNTEFNEHDIYTVNDVNWNSKKNGKLLNLMLAENFEVLLTFDKNLQFQQNFTKYPISVLILIEVDNTFLSLKPLVPIIKKVLKRSLKHGPTINKI